MRTEDIDTLITALRQYKREIAEQSSRCEPSHEAQDRAVRLSARLLPRLPLLRELRKMGYNP